MPPPDEASSRARNLGQVLRSFGVSSSDVADSLAYARTQLGRFDRAALQAEREANLMRSAFFNQSLGEPWTQPRQVLTPAQAAERIHRQLVEDGLLRPEDMDVRAEIDPEDPRRLNVSVVARIHDFTLDGQMVPGVVEVSQEIPLGQRSRWAMLDDWIDDEEKEAA